MADYSNKTLKGSILEEMINLTNETYRAKKLALVQKIPTPIKPVQIDGKGHITMAFFEQKSTVDYIGTVQGFPICFDAKECAVDTFSLQNVHDHQMVFMQEFEEQGGYAFFIINYTAKSKMYYVAYKVMQGFYDRARSGGRKSFRFEELMAQEAGVYEVQPAKSAPVHYIKALEQEIAARESEEA